MFDPLHKWLGIPPGDQPPHHYRLLGIANFEDDTDVIDAAADKHLAFLHDLTNGENAEMAEQLSNQVSAARICLLRRDKKKAYDDALRIQLERSNRADPSAVDPAYDVSTPAQVRATSASPSTSPTVRAGRKRASSRSGSTRTKQQRFLLFSTLLCIVALTLIAVGVKQGRISLDLSVLESLGLVSSTQSSAAPKAVVNARESAERQTQPRSTAQRSEPNAGDSSSGAPSTSRAMNAAGRQPPKRKRSKTQRSKTPGTRSLGDLVHPNTGTEDSSPIVKSPLPSESQLDKKRRLIRELYQDEYRSAKTTAEKIALARLMHREGQKTTNDPIGRFALWQVARDILTLQGDFTSAVAIVDNLDAHYLGVDSKRLKVETLQSLASHVPDARLSDYLGAVISVVTLCGEEENFDLANSLCTFVKQDLSSRLGTQENSDLAKVESEMRVTENSFLQYKEALQTLAESEDDPNANQKAGYYLCFIRGEWELGLKFLSLGIEPIVRSAAEQELAAGADASQAVAVADAWYQIAESERQSIAQAEIRRHATWWYRSARGGEEGLLLSKVNLRITKLERLLPAAANDAGPGSSSPSNVIGYRMKTSSESRSDFADRRGNEFTIGMGSRPDGRGEAQGGIEIQGVEKLSVVGSASHQDMPNVDPYSKTGFVIDYHTPGGYAKRVFLGTGLYPGRRFTDAPPWGTAREPEITTDIGRSASYEIDLKRWAPSTWDGRCWLTIYMQNAGVDRTLHATVSW